MSEAASDSPMRAEADARLCEALKRLLMLDATTVRGTMHGASQLVAETLAADKVDAFLYEAASESLVAVGVSDTPMAARQRAIGLDRLPLANGGRSVEVYVGGGNYRSGDVRADEGELLGLREGLGIQSCVAVPLTIQGQRRGVLNVSCARRDAFTRGDEEFLVAVAHWIGVATHRAELGEAMAREAEQHGRRLAAEELLVVFSHDLRNHLWAQSLRLSALLERARASGREDDVADLTAVRAGVQRLEQLAKDLLDVERLERDLFVWRPAQVDLAALVRETARVLSPGGAAIRVEGPEAMLVEVDPAAVRQALENLVSNALRYSPPGEPVELGLARDGSRVVVTVRDHGPGIAVDVLPRLFQRFTRGRDSAGLGIGLYLARKLVEAHGGSLEAVAPDGRGACFRVTLPAPPAGQSRPPGA